MRGLCCHSGLETWTEKNLVKFNKGRCHDLQQEKNNPIQSGKQLCIVHQSLCGQEAESALCCCSKEDQQFPGLQQEGHWQQVILSPGETMYGIQSIYAGNKREMDVFCWTFTGPAKGCKMMKGFEILKSEKLRGLGPFSLEKAQEASIKVYIQLMGGSKVNQTRLFSVLSTERTGGRN